MLADRRTIAASLGRATAQQPESRTSSWPARSAARQFQHPPLHSRMTPVATRPCPWRGRPALGQWTSRCDGVGRHRTRTHPAQRRHPVRRFSLPCEPAGRAASIGRSASSHFCSSVRRGRSAVESETDVDAPASDAVPGAGRSVAGSGWVGCHQRLPARTGSGHRHHYHTLHRHRCRRSPHHLHPRGVHLRHRPGDGGAPARRSCRRDLRLAVGQQRTGQQRTGDRQ